MAAGPGTTAALALLTSAGAAGIAHPGGTLLAHLRRVHDLLDAWDARPAVRLAGLCHAFYGTDGFPVALGGLPDRGRLGAAIGVEAETLVRLYGGCDRGFSHPRLASDGGEFRDRFTGAVFRPPRRLRRDFAELTVANELDVVSADAGLRARYGRELRDLCTAWHDLLSAPARQAVRIMLP
ncbi:hypothetical protein DPM19_34080 [Actinomadura craniellae]|uniref:DUF6817 domain-containing protein n=1 Tax=Actinomadura craniellae TaxID=2231787 RepID=A0A365GV61_9ACTN|nr:hypothetical protein [Actinomadura craniellae]RAY10687.1 hypothetical protein DPM19_34080 [Actinomadura craniellae]